MEANKHFDVGLVGYWYATNYGSVVTYYALSKAINALGKSTVIIDCPEKEKDPEGEDVFPRHFFKKHGNISESVRWNELERLNDVCDNFVIGSDQVWTVNATRGMRHMFYLPFVQKGKRKIAYAPSFGHNSLDLTEEEFAKVKGYLRTFNKISVREDVGINLVKEKFGVHADRVLDPVFLMDIEEYDRLADESPLALDDGYILVYLLDPTPDKEIAIQKTATELGLPVKIILDGRKGTFERNKAKLTIYNSDEYLLRDVSACDWIKCFQKASYVVTDSHHGLAMALIYKKQFICYANHGRGYARFTSLLNVLNLMDRMVQNSGEITPHYVNKSINYRKVHSIIDKEKRRSLEWLRDALTTDKLVECYPDPEPSREVTALHANPDFIKIRLLATLLRDYGIKHVVLSPGGRDVPIIRMFENNESQFTLHAVTDERSAAYYALGLAAQLKAPVACVCTSGTAASNYLPAVTEAYYTGIPMIVITADRYGAYFGQGEDQMIPQKHIYRDVVKMEVSLPDTGGYLSEYQIRRDVSNCILEATHNGWGPVHINVPVGDITIGANLSREHWALLPLIKPHILRVGFNDGERDMYRWVDALKKSPRILIVYGQTPPLSEEAKRDVERFASKYNCVITTDALSNLDSAYAVESYNLLNAITQEEFNQKLAPDIVISVGGKRLMNDPLTYKLRGGQNIRHWSVTPDGRIKDFYFKLSSVIECTQAQFFRWFADKAGNVSNDQKYLKTWKAMVEKYQPKHYDGFHSLYVQSKFIPAVPSGSVLHLGVGQSFIHMRRYKLNPNVEVFCNMGTNGIDGCTSTFMGQCAIEKNRMCYLLVGDLSFFYDMNSIWNKHPGKNVRILLVNNNGTGLLRNHNLKAVSSVHNTSAEGWVRSTGFEYMSAKNQAEFDEKLEYFMSNKSDAPLFFEVFCQ